MSNINARSNGSMITLSVECAEGEIHKVKYSITGELVEYPHDLDSEEVIVALNGSLYPCAKARHIYKAALMSFQAWAGFSDAEGIISLRSHEWSAKEGYSCSRCHNVSTSLQHLNSLSHFADLNGVLSYRSQVQTVFKWLARNSPGETGRVIEAASFLNQPAAHPTSLYSYDYRLRQTYMSKRYEDVVVALHPDATPDHKLVMRGFFTVKWLNVFYENLNDKALSKLRADFSIIEKIARARNCAPELVADFVNYGIYSHIYTYAKNHVAPQHAKLLYDSYGAEHSAKKFLEEGIPVARAVRELRAS